MESNFLKVETGYKHFIWKGWYEKLFSLHRKVSGFPAPMRAHQPSPTLEKAGGHPVKTCSLWCGKSHKGNTNSQLTNLCKTRKGWAIPWLNTFISTLHRIMPNKQIYKIWSLHMENLQTERRAKFKWINYLLQITHSDLLWDIDLVSG